MHLSQQFQKFSNQPAIHSFPHNHANENQSIKRNPHTPQQLSVWQVRFVPTVQGPGSNPRGISEPQSPNTNGAGGSENPISRLVAADGHSGQDGTPSLVAVPPDPPSGFRWQSTYHYVVCLSVPGAQTRRSEARYPVARVLLMDGYRTETAQSDATEQTQQKTKHEQDTSNAPPVGVNNPTGQVR